MKNKVILFIISLIVLFFLIIYNFDEIKKQILRDDNQINDALKFKEEYESINGTKNSKGRKYPIIEIADDNPIKYSSASEIEDIVKDGSGIIYLGYATCPWCRNAVPPLLQAASDAGVETIYYLDMYDERDIYSVNEDNELVLEKEGTSEYKKLLKLFDKYLDVYYLEDSEGKQIDTSMKRIYVPIVIFIKDGEVVGVHTDTVESQENPYVFLNDEQYEELYNIYSSYIHKVLDDLCDERC